MNSGIYQKLIKYKEETMHPWHMPGHKRNFHNDIKNPYDIDITEINGFDDLHDPSDCIKESMDFAREVYQTRETYFLVNGSTVGLLASISASCQKGDKIIIQRNCHKAVYNAIRIMELEPVYIYPEYNYELNLYSGIDLDKLKNLIEQYKDIKAIVLTSPSYEGIVINISGVNMLIKNKNITLIVDEAHGAHFCYNEDFPASAISQGADLVIQSLHKTLPSLTQTALLHVCSEKVDVSRVQEYLSIYQSSSPSYVFIASIDYCVRYCNEHKQLFSDSIALLNEYRLKFLNFMHLKLIGKEHIQKYCGFDYDISRLVISCRGTNMTGQQLYELLEKNYHIVLEMSEMDYVVAISSIMDKKEDYEYLYQALYEIDQQIGVKKNNIKFTNFSMTDRMAMKPSKALEQDAVCIPLEKSVGEVANSYVYIYPPGVPLLVPGERIEVQVVEQLIFYKENNFKIKGLIDGQVKVVDDKMNK